MNEQKLFVVRHRYLIVSISYGAAICGLGIAVVMLFTNFLGNWITEDWTRIAVAGGCFFTCIVFFNLGEYALAKNNETAKAEEEMAPNTATKTEDGQVLNVEDAPYETLAARLEKSRCLRCGTHAQAHHLHYGISLYDKTFQDLGNGTVEGAGSAFLPRGRVDVPFCADCIEAAAVTGPKVERRVGLIASLICLTFAGLLGYFIFQLDRSNVFDSFGLTEVMIFAALLSGIGGFGFLFASLESDPELGKTEEGREELREKYVTRIFRKKLLLYLDRYYPKEDPHFLVYPNAPFRFDRTKLPKPAQSIKNPDPFSFRISSVYGDLTRIDQDTYREGFHDDDGKVFERTFYETSVGGGATHHRITYRMAVMGEKEYLKSVG